MQRRSRLVQIYVDKRHQAVENNIQEGDLVLLKTRKENKLSSYYEKDPYQ